MKTFEHRAEFLICRAHIVEVANRLGIQGWELVAVVQPRDMPRGDEQHDLYFKRELRDTPRAVAERYVPLDAGCPNSACALH